MIAEPIIKKRFKTYRNGTLLKIKPIDIQYVDK